MKISCLLLLLAVAGVCLAAPVAPTEHAWLLDEGRGTTARDSAGKARARIHAARWVTGIRGKALQFDGRSSYAGLGDLRLFDGDFTLAAWVCPRGVRTREEMILAKDRSGVGAHQLRFYVGTGNRLGFVIADAAGNGIWPFETADGALPANRWSFVAVTRAGRTYTLWVNGRAAGTKTAEQEIRHENALELRLGARYGTAGDAPENVFDGLIDEARAWPRALSPEELAPPAELLRKAETMDVSITPMTRHGKLARPTPEQAAWQDLELGMFIHFAPNTWDNKEGDDLTVPLSEINPEKLDTDQWVDVAEAMGARYIIFVAKHVGGFCWWQTATTDYSVKSIPWRGGKGDVVHDLAESCRKRGMKLGVYISPCDRKHGVEVGGRCKTPAEQEAYNKLYRQQLTELLTHYGPMVEVWFDGSVIVPVGDILKRHAPKAMIFQGPHATIRWVGNEGGNAPYPAWNSLMTADARSGTATAANGRPDGDAWLPNEVDTVNVTPHTWFWNTNPARTLRSVDDLMDCYTRSVGHGAVLLLNQTPDTTGRIPEADARRAAEFGAEIRRRFGKSLAETAGAGDTVELALPAPAAVDHVITMEEIRQGERVHEYVIEGLAGGAWRELCRGTAIGHKKIDRFDPVEVTKIRLRVTESAGRPEIRQLAAYAVGAR